MHMRVAALYDIHGNLPALEAVLAEVQEIGPDLVLVGGDVVLGPFPRETLEALDELRERAVFIRGNTDRMLVHPTPEAEAAPWAARHDWVRGQLTDRQAERFVGLSDTSVIEVDGLGEVLFCHGSPRSDEEIVTRATSPERLSDILSGVEQRVVVCGHTHVQFDRTVGGTRIVNAGSVGMPYEDARGAYWALLGPDVALRRTTYDLDRAARAVRATGFPDAEEFAEEYLLHPASAAEATEHFERMAASAG
jgi:putative phosphoesterase